MIPPAPILCELGLKINDNDEDIWYDLTMNLNDSQHRLLQHLDMRRWTKRPKSPIFVIRAGSKQLGLEFLPQESMKAKEIIQKISTMLKINFLEGQSFDKVVQCACEPRAVYETIRDECLE